MHYENLNLRLSASDLIAHLNCRHLTALDQAVARGEVAKPSAWNPELDLLRERGARHEAAYIAYLRETGHQVVVIEGRGIDATSMAATSAAMQAGAEVIVQAALGDDTWSGRADVLKQVPKSSKLGDWSYEVIDTKLARETKGGTVLQLCLYSDLVAQVQGTWPEYAHVIAPFRDFKPETFRLDDYAAYSRQVRRSLGQAVSETSATYPLPVAHCEICRWRNACDQKRHDDDHLSIVANMSTMHATELEEHGIASAARLAAEPLPLTWRPEYGSRPTYERLREQARVQVEGREAGQLIWEPIPFEPGAGLGRLPTPSGGDIYFDLEGDPFVGEGGREYLFGYAIKDELSVSQYVSEWALTSQDEKAAFERFVGRPPLGGPGLMLVHDGCLRQGRCRGCGWSGFGNWPDEGVRRRWSIAQ